MTKTPLKQFGILDNLISILISHFYENKYISKKAESIFEQLLLQSKQSQPFLGVINKSLLKLQQYDSTQNSSLYLPVILKLQTKLIRNMSKSVLSQVVEEVFKQVVMTNINHSNAEVRKNVVFCLVEMRLVFGEEGFKQFGDKLPHS